MNTLLEETYKQLRSELKAFIQHRVNSSELAEDILHDVFLKAHTNIGKLKDPSKLNGWIYTIARNSITDHYRTRKITADIDDYDISDNAEESQAVKGLEPSVRSLLRYLPPIYREAIVLADFKGMPHKALAEKLNISVSAVKSRVQRARAMMRDLFLECCHFEFDKFGGVIDYHSQNECRKCACH